MDIVKLHATIAAVCPIYGVSADANVPRSSWAIDFRPEATDEQKAVAQDILAAYNEAGVVPEEVSPYQARIALLNAGLLDAVESLMENPSTAQEARIAWEYATTIQRHSAFISALAPALGLTEEQVDALFIAAAAIE